MSEHLRLLQILALAAALFAPPASPTPIGPITGITVAENGIGPRSEDCGSFVVTPAQVHAFLDRAVLISGRQQHDFFLYGPCSAHGTFKNRYDTWQWEIRNMGTGSIVATNGDTFLLGDPAQESSLSDE
jgi:hypothetical protein